MNATAVPRAAGESREPPARAETRKHGEEGGREGGEAGGRVLPQQAREVVPPWGGGKGGRGRGCSEFPRARRRRLLRRACG